MYCYRQPCECRNPLRMPISHILLGCILCCAKAQQEEKWARIFFTCKWRALQRWLLPLLATVQREPAPHAGHESAFDPDAHANLLYDNVLIHLTICRPLLLS